MSKAAIAASGSQPEMIVDLKDPIVAAVLAYLLPGLGHIYQGRTGKGVLFMICILSTFFYGEMISDWRVVYASRLPYVCQVAAGLPALPALLQTYLVSHDKTPLFHGAMAPPANEAELNEWYRSLNRYFDLGTVYTMIAGLLNILVIYDAWGGPVPLDGEEEKKSPHGSVPAGG